MANLRRRGTKNGLGKDPERATVRAAQLTAIDPDWDCPWPLNWQRHYRALADLIDTEAGGVLPDIEPEVLMDGDDLGRWLQQQQKPAAWAGRLPAQQELLTPSACSPPRHRLPPRRPHSLRKGPSKAQRAFQRGLAALAQWIEREGADRPVPRGHGEEITVDDEDQPVIVKLG
ncbi:hypothetical protein [Streptomyces sp. NPDC058486]|uniref:hypothetical protein n=1 Tax=unclassified Streptomyces TaxID=2593676 RepID=UPI00364DD24C